MIYALIAGTTNNFVWFALTYWAYLSTKSVVATGIVGGVFLVATVVSGFWFGSLVDHHKKKHVLLGSSMASLLFYMVGFLFFINSSSTAFGAVTDVSFWIFVFILLAGVVAGSILNIAIPTLVTSLVPKDQYDRANGLFGTVMGVSFALTSVASGLVYGYGGMSWVLATALCGTVLAALYMSLLHIPERQESVSDSQNVESAQEKSKHIDILGTLRTIQAIPGLLALIFYATFNNFLGGVFMALMDAYGLSLVSVQQWGMLWGVLSLGFIIGGLLIAKFGLGKNPLSTLFRINIVTWTVCMVFTIQPSIILLAIGMMIWMTLFPFIEAAEQTIIQKVVPPGRQGRVFGFSQSVEQAASPLTAFMIGPIAQFIFIPFMTTGAGVDLIGSWFGTGIGRGLALVFTMTGLVGFIITLIVMRSGTYKLLSKRYAKNK